MRDIALEFIHLKESLLDTSKFLTEHLADYENYNHVTFRNQILTIQSKLSTLISLSNTRPRKTTLFKKMAEDLLDIAREVEMSENSIQRAYNIGKLAGASSIYLNEVNSIVLKIV